MKYNGLEIYLLFIILMLYVMPFSFLNAQTSDIIRQSLMGQSDQVNEPNIEVPSLGEGPSGLRSSDILPDEVSLMYPEQSLILLDKRLDPTVYIVGPGDLFGIYLWGEIERSYQVRVTPEGYLIIPSVGTVMVADKTIAELREEVENVIKKNYKDLTVSIFLIEPRRFRLYVSGLVYIPGMHESHALERVSDLIDRAGLIIPESELDKEERIQKIQENISSGTEGVGQTGTGTTDLTGITVPKRAGVVGRTLASSLGRRDVVGRINMIEPEDLFTLGEKRGSSSRSIIIHRENEEITADLLRFIKLGDLDANPYVNSGDHIEVPPYGGDIIVYGEVNDQGIYEYESGDRVCDLIGFGGGLTSVADTSNASLVRFSSDGQSFEEITIDLYDALYKNPDNSEYILHESDRLNVRKKYNYKILSDVTVYGEVKYPGQYAIEKNITKLSELIQMAGGFTGDENLREARLIRKSNFATKDLEYERLKNLRMEETTLLERDYVRSYQRTFEGSINTDFVKLFNENDLNYDVILQDGDIVYIPVIRDMVNVMGAVKEPGYIKVKEGEEFNYYIEKAGGFNWNAQKRDARILKARTSQQYRPGKNVKIEGGDTIHIPERPLRTFWSYFREYTSYATTVATVVLITVQLTKP